VAERGVWQADPPPPEGWAVVYFKDRGPTRPERYYTYPPGNRSAIDADAWLWLPPVAEPGVGQAAPDSAPIGTAPVDHIRHGPFCTCWPESDLTV
jgi:hypothetical protein